MGVKVAVFWICVAAVVGAIGWTVTNILRGQGESAKVTAERILRDRGMTKVVIDGSPGRGDIWCPAGTGSVLFTGTEKTGRSMKGVICTVRSEGIVLTLE